MDLQIVGVCMVNLEIEVVEITVSHIKSYGSQLGGKISGP
jgi:hypothetical protein